MPQDDSSGAEMTMLDPMYLTIDGAVAASGLARSRIYLLIAAGTLRARKAGKRTLVDGDSLRVYLDSLPEAVIRYGRRARQPEAATA